MHASEVGSQRRVLVASKATKRLLKVKEPCQIGRLHRDVRTLVPVWSGTRGLEVIFFQRAGLLGSSRPSGSVRMEDRDIGMLYQPQLVLEHDIMETLIS